MTIDQYKEKVRELVIEFKNNKKQLAKEFALANNPYKVGDIFTDHIGSVKVEKISVYLSLDIPSCVYEGLVVKSDGTPAKKLGKRSAFQVNEKKLAAKSV
jgi:hypothetical protein